MTASQLYTLAPMIQGDQRDAILMAIFTLTRAKLLPHKRAMLLAGLSAFQRTVTED